MHRLIQHLEILASPDRGDRGALAVLRRGVSAPPGMYVPMFQYILPYLTEEEQEYHFSLFCQVAALFAYYPLAGGRGNLGDHMRQTGRQGPDSLVVAEALERRFITLLRAHTDDLPNHLFRAIAFLKSKGIPVNWGQLLLDLTQWESNSDMVRKAWARSFWGYFKEQAETELIAATETNSELEE